MDKSKPGECMIDLQQLLDPPESRVWSLKSLVGSLKSDSSIWHLDVVFLLRDQVPFLGDRRAGEAFSFHACRYCTVVLVYRSMYVC